MLSALFRQPNDGIGLIERGCSQIVGLDAIGPVASPSPKTRIGLNMCTSPLCLLVTPVAYTHSIYLILLSLLRISLQLAQGVLPLPSWFAWAFPACWDCWDKRPSAAF